MAKVKSQAAKTKAKVEGPSTKRGEERRDALLRAARDVFLEKGYAGTSVEAVMARVGGGSKATLYSYFGNKDGLFNNIIRLKTDEYLADLAIPKEPEDDLAAQLIRFGMRGVRKFTDPERTATMRVMIGEASRFPKLAQMVYDNGPRRGLAQMTDFLRRCHELGRMYCPKPEYAAMQFMEMIKAHAQWRALLGLPPFDEGYNVEEHVREVVHTFLHGRLEAPKKTR